MDHVVISSGSWEGRYPFDLETQPLTSREWGWIKRFAGYLPLTVEDGFGDPELLTVLAAVALRRAGRIDAAAVPATVDRLADLPFGEAITLETEEADQAADAGPPARRSSSSGGTSGDDSPTSSETPASPPSRTGSLASATSASGPMRSAS